MNGQIVSTQNIVDDVYWLFLACSDLTHMAVKENVTLKGSITDREVKTENKTTSVDLTSLFGTTFLEIIYFLT